MSLPPPPPPPPPPRHICHSNGTEPGSICYGDVLGKVEPSSICLSTLLGIVGPGSICSSPSLQQQMAHWNKMVAYLNLALLFILLLLLISLVIFMNYFWLLHQMPTTTASGSLDIDPSYLSSGPMA